MVKILPKNEDPFARPFARGHFYTRNTMFGWVAQKWPVKRGKPKTPYDFYRQREFAIAARWASSPQPTEYENALALAKGSTNVWRDILTAAAFGSLIRITLRDGTQSKQQRKMTNNPQYMLDLVTDVVGSMLYRAPEGWIGVPPGNNGDVLTMDLTVPIWNPGYAIPNPTYASLLLDQLGLDEGDMLYRSATEWLVLNAGSAGQVLTQGASLPEWADPANPDIQFLLDTIGSTTGDILYRNASDWVVLAPGSNGKVLTLAAGLPSWATPAAPALSTIGMPFNGQIRPNTAAAVTNNVLSGTGLLLQSGQIITSLQIIGQAASATTTITPAIYDMPANIPTNLLSSGPVATGIVKGLNTFPLTTPYTVPATALYALGLQTKVVGWNQGSTNGTIWGWRVNAAAGLPNPLVAVADSYVATDAKVWAI